MSERVKDVATSVLTALVALQGCATHVVSSNERSVIVASQWLNIEKAPELASKSLDDLIRGINSVPEAVRTAVRNNGGGHWNHSMFWKWMAPNAGGAPGGEIGKAINDSFGGFDKFKEQWSAAGAGRFGSGWVWLMNEGGKLSITSTPNQDNPLMEGKSAPILGLDVWEHAYYLRYQNKRPDYITAWWNVVNWEEVESAFSK